MSFCIKQKNLGETGGALAETPENCLASSPLTIW